MSEQNQEEHPETAEGPAAEDMSEKVPEGASGEEATPLGDTDQHSDAPGPHGLGEQEDGGTS